METSTNLFIDPMNSLEKSAFFKVSPDLECFLSLSQRGKIVSLQFKGSQSAKHLIESIGIPHTEVSFLQINKRSGDLSYIVQDDDWIEVFSISDHFPENIAVRVLPDARFILDNHLGKLARYLRMLGLDCLYDPSLQDIELAEISHQDQRILLTRDRRLLMRKIIYSGYFVRAKQPQQQATEIIQRFSLSDKIHPFLRCIRCNHLLRPVEKETVLERLQPKTRLYYNKFHICSHCNQIYWQGSHYERMLNLINDLLAPNHGKVSA
jgi:hypothetical protein